MFLEVVGLVVLFSSSALGDPCSWGAHYRCGDVRAVRRCNSIEECKTTVWNNAEFTQAFTQDTSEVCLYCVELVEKIKAAFNADTSEADVATLLRPACAKLADNHHLLTECQALMDMYIEAVKHILSGGIDARIICGLIKFCGTRHQGAGANRLAEGLDRTPATPPPSSQTGSMCDYCNAFFKEFDDLLLANATEVALETLVTNQLCSRLGLYEAECTSLVKKYLPVLLKTLADNSNPNLLCQKLGCCTLAGGPILTGERTRCQSPRTGETDYSLLCSTMVQQLEQKENIENFFFEKICSGPGAAEANCQGSVSRFVRPFVEILVQTLNLGPRCRELVTGQSGGGRGPPNDMNRPTPMREAGQRMPEENCGICMTVVAKLNGMLQNQPGSQVDPGLLASKVCQTLPATWTSSCTTFFGQQDLNKILDLLKTNRDPMLVCQSLEACMTARRR